MKGMIGKVFLVIAILVVIFMAWQIIFNQGGVIVTGYNAVVGIVNGQWAKVAGAGHQLIPVWNVDTNGTAGDIGTGN